MVKELWYLIKLLFSHISNELEIVKLKHFPFSGFAYMMWCGKLITKTDNPIDKYDYNHENIHLQQAQLVGSWWKYYLTYLWEWIKGNPFRKSSYYMIPFELEAYMNDCYLDYKVDEDSWCLYDKDNRNSWYKMYWYTYVLYPNYKVRNGIDVLD